MVAKRDILRVGTHFFAGFMAKPAKKLPAQGALLFLHRALTPDVPTYYPKWSRAPSDVVYEERPLWVNS